MRQRLAWPYRAEGRLWLRSNPSLTDPNGGHDGWTTVCTDQGQTPVGQGMSRGRLRVVAGPEQAGAVAEDGEVPCISLVALHMVHFSSRPALVVRVGSCTRAGRGNGTRHSPASLVRALRRQGAVHALPGRLEVFPIIVVSETRAATSASTRVRAGLSAKRARAMCASSGKFCPERMGGACAPTRRPAGRRRHTPHRQYNRSAGAASVNHKPEGTVPG